MADRCLRFTGTAPGRFPTRRLGLPQPAPLRRWSPAHPRLDGGLLHLSAGTSGLGPAPVLARTGLTAHDRGDAGTADSAGTADGPGTAGAGAGGKGRAGRGPADVAGTTAWLAHPASGAVDGQVVRVCGQSLLGA